MRGALQRVVVVSEARRERLRTCTVSDHPGTRPPSVPTRPTEYKLTEEDIRSDHQNGG